MRQGHDGLMSSIVSLLCGLAARTSPPARSCPRGDPRARVAQQVVGGPGGEGHLRHQARIDPAGPLLIGARHRDEGQCVALDLAKALGELAARGQGEARVALPEKISFPA
jgi:hypothetical protein